MELSLAAPNLGQGPQPNGDLDQHILDIANEVALFQNAPALPAIHNLVLQMQQQQAAILQQQAAILQQLQLLTNSVNNLQARYAFFLFLLFIYSPPHSIVLIPMQFFNATASAEAPLMLPPGIAAPPLPLTKKKLLKLSGRIYNYKCDILTIVLQL